MKKIFLFALLLGSLNLFAQEIEAVEEDTLYYIQLFSTQNPELVRAEHLAMAQDEIVYEKEGDHYNFLVFYGDLETAEVMLYTWQRAHKKAFITTRTTKDAKGLYPFYTEN
jgi:hypothetical protein